MRDSARESGKATEIECGDPRHVATFLYRIGRGAFRRRWLVVLLWAVLLGAAGAGAAKAPAAGDDGTSFMPGIEAQKAFDLIGERFPGPDADGADARVVFIAPGGEKVTAAEHRAAIEEFVAEAGAGPRVAGAVDPFAARAVSEDASTAYATVTFEVAAGDLTDADRDALERAVDEVRDTGLTVEVGGSALSSQPAAGGAAEAIGIGLAAVVLLITFGSLAAAGLPLLTAVIGVGISMGAILALGSTLHGAGPARLQRRCGPERAASSARTWAPTSSWPASGPWPPVTPCSPPRRPGFSSPASWPPPTTTPRSPRPNAWPASPNANARSWRWPRTAGPTRRSPTTWCSVR